MSAIRPPHSGLAGKVAIVSGASRGLGRAYALALAAAGARVMATARSADGDPGTPGSLAELVATAGAAGGTVAACRCDVGDPADIAAAVAQTVEMFGGLDILVNNAVAPIHKLDFLAVDDVEWDAVFAINVKAPFRFMREAIPHMAARKGGAIVNITSAAAQPTVPGSGAHGFPAYGVSKAALDRLTTYFAAECAAMNIAVNAVSPGFVAYVTDRGREPDPVFWGDPLVHLAAQRPADGGLTGQILHTYQFGRSWGPKRAARTWDTDITAILEQAGLAG